MTAYTDSDVIDGMHALNAWDEDTSDPRSSMVAILDAIAPAIAARAKVEALRDLIRYCFDEQDAAVVVGGIETVEVYVFDTIAALTGEESDQDAARTVRRYATESFAAKVGRADEIEQS